MDEIKSEVDARNGGPRHALACVVRYAVLNIPAFVLLIMIVCCAIADVFVCHKPRMLWTAMPIAWITYKYLKKYPESEGVGKPHV